MSKSIAAKRKPGRPKLDREDGRLAIRTAALKEFARCGFKGASIEAIARSAGVAKPLVHYHFASKEALWKESLAEAFEGLKAEAVQFTTEFSAREPQAAADEFAHSIVRFSADNPWLVRIAVDETRQGGERAQWLKQNYLQPLQKMLVATVETVFSRAPRQFAAHVIPTIFGAINFPFIDDEVIAEVHQVDVFSEDYIAAQAELVAVMLRACLTHYA